MNEVPIQLDLFAIIIFLGVIQGLFLSFFFLNKRIRQKPSNLYLGFIMLTLSLIILEIFLVHTNYMYSILRIDNFSEPFSFAVAPLMYFYIYSSITKNAPRLTWIHLIPMFFWLFYCFWFYFQPMELKQIQYLIYHDLDTINESPKAPFKEDPLGLRNYTLEMVILQVTSYLILSIILIRKSFKSLGISFFTSKIRPISWLRNFVFLFFAILLSMVVVTIVFPLVDLGSFIIGSIISVVIYATSFNVIRTSDFFQENVSDPFNPVKKYEKSALQDEEKNNILTQLKHCMEVDKDFRNHLVSLPALANKLNTSVHHISQVINEKLNQTFFEYIALYRVEEAKSILKDQSRDNPTIEDIADEVGYNSISAFNRSFKKITGFTPSEYRNN